MSEVPGTTSGGGDTTINPGHATGTPQGESIPGPTNPHPDGMNDPDEQADPKQQ